MKILARCRQALRVPLIVALTLVGLVAFATQAQASVTIVHDTGQITFKDSSNHVLSQMGFDGESFKYPSGSNQAYKPWNLTFHNFAGSYDELVCNTWYGNDNAGSYPGLSSSTFSGNANGVPASCIGAKVAVVANSYLVDVIYTANDDGTNQNCANGTGWIVCPPPASAGPGGTGDLHPDWNFGVFMGTNSNGNWWCYKGVRLAIGGGTGQNVTMTGC